MDLLPGFEMVSSTQESVVVWQLAALKGPLLPKGGYPGKESPPEGNCIEYRPEFGLLRRAQWTQAELEFDPAEDKA